MANLRFAAFPVPGGFEEGGIDKLEYFALKIYAAKLATNHNENNSDILIKQAIAEAKKLLAELDRA